MSILNQLIEITTADDDTLTEAKEEIIAVLTEGKGTTLDQYINDLLEIERELTLRENN